MKTKRVRTKLSLNDVTLAKNKKNMEPSLFIIDANGHNLALWEKSSKNPTHAILLIHGRTWSARPNFDLQVHGKNVSLMDSLVERGYTVFALDMRGYGRTPRDKTGWLTPSRAARDVAIALEWIARRETLLSQPVVSGWSLGAMVAQLAVQRCKGLASGIILYGYPFDTKSTKLFRNPEGDPSHTPNKPEAASVDFTMKETVHASVVKEYVRSALITDPIRVDWNNLEEWRELDPQKIHVPTLLIQFEGDPHATYQKQFALFSGLAAQHKEWVMISGCDHMAFLGSARDTFISNLTDFIERLC